jgi:hypothetical protein
VTERPRRFTLRNGIEETPAQPIFDDAPRRLRFFVLDFARDNFHSHVAKDVVARALCLPDMLVSRRDMGGDTWQQLQGPIFNCKWGELFNLLEAMYQALLIRSDGFHRKLVDGLNQTFSEESIGWRMDGEGRLVRLLPAATQAEAESVFRELQNTRFAPALANVESAYDAFNARPRRDQEVCSSAFDALESVAKEVFSMPTATFGDVIKEARKRTVFASETLTILEKLYAMASSHFRHGMTEPFRLTPPEVEFVYVSSMAGILLFVRHDARSAL